MDVPNILHILSTVISEIYSKAILLNISLTEG